MRGMFRFGLLAAMLVLASVVLFACGGGDDQSSAGASTTAQTQTTAQDGTTLASESTATTAEEAATEAETEVSGMPGEFPKDVPVHPGTVTAYEPVKATDTTTVHQLTLVTAASMDDVIEWYKTKLPSGWSVGFLEEKDGQAKIALNGGSYTPADPDGMGGGVLLGLQEGDKTTIVITVTVMGK